MKSKFAEEYVMLGLEPFTSASQVKKAWRRWAATWHPDKVDGDAKKFDEGKQAQCLLLGVLAEAERDQFRRRNREARRQENGKYASTTGGVADSTLGEHAGGEADDAAPQGTDLGGAQASAREPSSGLGFDEPPRDPPDNGVAFLLSEFWPPQAATTPKPEAHAKDLAPPPSTGMSAGGKLLATVVALTATAFVLTRNRKDANGARHSRGSGQFTSAFHDLFGYPARSP